MKVYDRIAITRFMLADTNAALRRIEARIDPGVGFHSAP